MARTPTVRVSRPKQVMTWPERISAHWLAILMPVALMTLLGVGSLITLSIVPSSGDTTQNVPVNAPQVSQPQEVQPQVNNPVGIPFYTVTLQELGIEYAPEQFGGNVYSNPAKGTVYVVQMSGAAGYLVWRSTDWGESWESLGLGDVFAKETSTEVTVVVGSFRDTVPLHTWYSGDPYNTSSASAARLAGEARAPDIHAIRVVLEAEFLTPPQNTLTSVVVAYDPINPELVLFGAGIGNTSLPRTQWDIVLVLFFSADGGETWEEVKMTPALEPWGRLTSFSSLGIVKDAKGSIHLFVGTDRMWHTVLPAE